MTVTPPRRARPPSSDGFGFMRRAVKRTPFPGCTLELPGYFYEHDDEETRQGLLVRRPRRARRRGW